MHLNPKTYLLILFFLLAPQLVYAEFGTPGCRGTGITCSQALLNANPPCYQDGNDCVCPASPDDGSVTSNYPCRCGGVASLPGWTSGTCHSLTPYCSLGGMVCVECKSNSHCGGLDDICDPVRNVCTRCQCKEGDYGDHCNANGPCYDQEACENDCCRIPMLVYPGE